MFDLYFIGCLIMFGATLTVPKNEFATLTLKIFFILLSWIGLGMMLGVIANNIDELLNPKENKDGFDKRDF